MNPDPRSPRDWLLARHAAAQPALDALRRAATQACATPTTAPDVLPHDSVLRTLFYPQRRWWVAFAAAWAVLLALNFTVGKVPRRETADRVSAAAIAGWLNELKTHESFAQADRLR